MCSAASVINLIVCNYPTEFPKWTIHQKLSPATLQISGSSKRTAHDEITEPERPQSSSDAKAAMCTCKLESPAHSGISTTSLPWLSHCPGRQHIHTYKT